MSKAPKNLDKILLGVAAVAGIGFAALGFMKAGAVEEDFSSTTKSGGGSDTSVPGAAKVSETINSVKLDRVIGIGETSTGRPVDLFVGVPLYAQRENPNEPVDPLTSPEVHPPIPNTWWIEYNIEPNFADSPQRDEDGDGFTNLEEFQGKTDPSKASSHPPLVAKLSYLKDESYEWLVEFGFETAGKWLPKIVDGAGGKNRVDFQAGLSVGDEFFAAGLLPKRFKFIGMEDRQIRNERANIDETVRFAIFEDLKENKKGQRYEIPNRLPRAERPKWSQYDRTAVVELQALGLEGKEIKIEERTRFALPSDAPNKNYFLKSVTPDEIEVEWQDESGQTQSVKIPKGGLPQMP